MTCARTVGEWRLGTFGTSAQLAFAAGVEAGAAGGPARAVGVGPERNDESGIECFLQQIQFNLNWFTNSVETERRMIEAADVLREFQAAIALRKAELDNQEAMCEAVSILQSMRHGS